MPKKHSHYYVYIISNLYGVLYTGVTSDLIRRLEQHQQGTGSGFTKKYKVARLVYWEVTSDVHSALSKGKEIKSWRRNEKLVLIRNINPTFRDLSDEILGD